MNDQFDLREALAAWPYSSENNARIIQGDDGRAILQVRQPVGIEQYELEGRPDGRRPHDTESALAHHESRLAAAREAGKGESFKLSARDCAELFEEGVLYYYRYLNLFQLKQWARVLRDTQRNLQLFNFVRDYARREEDRQHLEQWRPYLLRMHAVAQAMNLVDADRYEDALKVIHEAIATIEALEEMENPTFAFERDRSLGALRELAEHIEQTRPISPLERLERELEQAITAQEFERAAQLRDRIRALRSPTS